LNFYTKDIQIIYLDQPIILIYSFVWYPPPRLNLLSGSGHQTIASWEVIQKFSNRPNGIRLKANAA